MTPSPSHDALPSHSMELHCARILGKSAIFWLARNQISILRPHSISVEKAAWLCCQCSMFTWSRCQVTVKQSGGWLEQRFCMTQHSTAQHDLAQHSTAQQRFAIHISLPFFWMISNACDGSICQPYSQHYAGKDIKHDKMSALWKDFEPISPFERFQTLEYNSSMILSFVEWLLFPTTAPGFRTDWCIIKVFIILTKFVFIPKLHMCTRFSLNSATCYPVRMLFCYIGICMSRTSCLR